MRVAVTVRRKIVASASQISDRDALRRMTRYPIVKSGPDVFRWYAYGSSINLKGSETRDCMPSRLVSSYSLSSSPLPLSSEGRERTSLVLSELTFEVSDWNRSAAALKISAPFIDKTPRPFSPSPPYFSFSRDDERETWSRFANNRSNLVFSLHLKSNLRYNKLKRARAHKNRS